MNDYFCRIGITLSMLLNVILGGHLYQTFSARNYGWKRDNKFNLVLLIDITSKITYIILLKPLTSYRNWYNITEIKEHCFDAWVYWRIERRKQINKELHNGKARRKI